MKEATVQSRVGAGDDAVLSRKWNGAQIHGSGELKLALAERPELEEIQIPVRKFEQTLLHSRLCIPA